MFEEDDEDYELEFQNSPLRGRSPPPSPFHSFPSPTAPPRQMQVWLEKRTQLTPLVPRTVSVIVVNQILKDAMSCCLTSVTHLSRTGKTWSNF